MPSPAAANPALDKLAALYEERIAELKAQVENLHLDAKLQAEIILDLRKRVEMVPRMVTSSETHDWKPGDINDQPVFDGDMDLKIIKQDWERELSALQEEHLTTVVQP